MVATTNDGKIAGRTQPGRYTDLFIILSCGILFGCLSGIPELFSFHLNGFPGWFFGGLRLILGIAFVLYIPGYLLQSVFFSHNNELDMIERVGLSLGLSVALVTLLTLLINALPWGLRPWPILIGQFSLILVLILVTIVARKILPGDQAHIPQGLPNLSKWWTSLRSGERNVMLIMAGALFIAIITAAWIFLTPSPNQYMTEFYILGQEGLAEDYPREMIMGQILTITTGITNREGITSTYSIQIKSNDQVIGQAGPITLENKATWEQAVEFTVAKVGDDQQITFILYREGQPTPYRTLQLWINVKPAQAP